MKKPTTQYTQALPRFAPLNSGIALQIVPQEMSPGGIAFPDSVKRDDTYDAMEAWVIAVGDGCKRVKPGMLVICGNMPMQEFRYKGDVYTMTVEEHLFGIVNGITRDPNPGQGSRDGDEHSGDLIPIR